VIVPAYNEEDRIGPVIDAALRITPHVVVIDDGSSDRTADVAMGRDVWVVAHPVNLGQGAALQTGIDFALGRGATYLVTFDADGQHRPEDIPRLVEALVDSGADFALGSRFLGSADGIPWTRALVLRAGVLFTRLVSRVDVSDAHNGLRAMTRRGAETLRIRFNGMEHASEIIDAVGKSGLKYVEVPVRIRYTAATLAKGQSTGAAVGIGIRVLLSKFAR
jgi:glycosyltransferase involved in cell wall biosynthesis